MYLYGKKSPEMKFTLLNQICHVWLMVTYIKAYGFQPMPTKHEGIQIVVGWWSEAVMPTKDDMHNWALLKLVEEQYNGEVNT